MDEKQHNLREAGPAADTSHRFLFDEADIRGETVCVDAALRGILDNHQYAPGVAYLIGEFVAAAVLISSTLKFDGRLTLQARSRGQVPLLMAECTSDLDVRAIARGAQEATALTFNELIGEGQLAITIEPAG
ncbi:MAG: Hsp33 family molecular chaperone HslO, partial [Chromatocurvus sp.]